MCATLPEPKPTRFAAEGTLFHRIIGACLRFDLEPSDFEGEEMIADGFKFTVGEEMVDHVYDGMDQLFSYGPKNMILETRVDLDRWFAGQSGTCDVGWYDDEWINILDWKYGAGLPVFAKENPQAMGYGAGFWNQIARLKTKAKKVRIIIVQPRNKVGGGEWETTLDELLDWAESAGKKITAATKSKGKLVPGVKQCQFCPAKIAGKCSAYDAFSLEAMQMKFDDLDAGKEKPTMAGMNMRRRAYVAEHSAFLIDWIQSQHSAVLDAALKGDDTFGVKAVLGRRSPAKWDKPERAEAELLELLPKTKVFKQKLISPTQAEKLLDKKFELISDLVQYGDKKPILVTVDDDRPRIKSHVDKFDKL